MSFNSQPRKGADVTICKTIKVRLCFNSQPRKGADGNFTQFSHISHARFCAHCT